MLKKTPVYQTIYHFFDCYLQKRELNKIGTFLSEHVLCVGTGEHEMAVGRTKFLNLLQTKLQKRPNPIDFMIYDYQEYEYTPGHWNCFFRMKMTSKEKVPVLYHVQVSAGVCQVGEMHQIHMLHISEESTYQQDKELSSGQCKTDHRMELNQESQLGLMEMISQVMPGGIIGTYLEEGYPLYAVNDHFLAMTGYTYEEYIQDIQGSAYSGIHPDDYLYVTKTITQALEEGEQYELEYRLKRRDGSYFWIREIAKKTVTPDGRQAVISMILDITKQVQMHQILKDLSTKDPLTGAYNRRGGYEQIESAMAEQGKNYLFLMLDLDCFKQVNDLYGHNHGDDVLRFLVEKLRQNFRKTDVICRLGGDEFAVFLPDCPPNQVIEQKISNVMQEYGRMIEEKYPKSHSSVSFGGIYGSTNYSFMELYQLADDVLYDVKQKKKGSFQVRMV